ncbi:MAG TPA: hypothetical protein VK906_12560 [Egicoccus sp.]|nr:hypothetical protein [Egicoccus sp.]HSK24007.1 hypothetical protein [Egicoccus sp.]
MTAEIVPKSRRWRAVIAVSILVSLICIGWWGVRLQWFVREPDISEHVITFDPQVVTLGDGAQAQLGVAAVVIGEDGVAPVAGAADAVRAMLVEHGLTLDVGVLRSGDGQNRLRADLVGELRRLAPEAAIERALLTEVLVVD